MRAGGHSSRAPRHGLTLVELIGVLSVLTILATLILPRVIGTLGSARIAATAAAIDAQKNALTDFFRRYGNVPVLGANDRIDDLLVVSGYVEGRFRPSIGTVLTAPPAGATWTYSGTAWTSSGGSSQNGITRVVSGAVNQATVPGNGYNFRLDGTNNLPASRIVVAAYIAGVNAADAWELSRLIDGDSLSQTASGTADTRGRVAYAAGNGTVAVWIYLGHF